jgi:hypothetical protein
MFQRDGGVTGFGSPLRNRYPFVSIFDSPYPWLYEHPYPRILLDSASAVIRCLKETTTVGYLELKKDADQPIFPSLQEKAPPPHPFWCWAY